MKDFIKYVFATVTGIVVFFLIMGILFVISLVGLAASSASSVPVEKWKNAPAKTLWDS